MARHALIVTASALLIATATLLVGAPASASTRSSRAAQSSTPCVIPASGKLGIIPQVPGSALAGPAVTSLKGGAAQTSFSLDGNNLVVDPPAPADHPIISAKQAECDAMASLNLQGEQLSGTFSSGVAVGYGRVTIAPHLFPPLSRIPGLIDDTPGDVQPKFGRVEFYDNRLAWVVVFTHHVVASCPYTAATTTTTAPLPTDHDYQVFVVDAHTGSDALIYTESAPGLCGSSSRMQPSLVQAREQVSVPWTLKSRHAHGYSGTIAATVLPCDGYSDPVFIDQGGSGLEVLVTGPVGARCGAARHIHLTVDAATVTSDLPATIVHDPVGLYTGLQPLPATRNSVTLRPLINLGGQENGQTLTIPAGDVVVVQPLQSLTTVTGFVSPIVSSNSAVLGGLNKPQPLAAEFRAWKVGRADLSIPASKCRSVPAGKSTCFIVHFVIR
jgi:hypothetical protein